MILNLRRNKMAIILISAVLVAIVLTYPEWSYKQWYYKSKNRCIKNNSYFSGK